MCFSAQASFVVGGALLPAGAYCVGAALVKRPRYLGLAVAPLLFGAQQIAEGFVWLGMDANDPGVTRQGALVFLFFALAFWPFCLPLSAAIVETQPIRRRLFAALAFLSASWFWMLFFPLVAGPDSLLRVEVVHHSIHYDYSGLPIYHYIPRLPLRLFYLLCVVLPFLGGSESSGILPGLALGLAALVSALVFDYAFISVWCFFAAIVAGACCWIFYRLPMPLVEQRS